MSLTIRRPALLPILFGLLAISLPDLSYSQATQAHHPVPLIFDTDMGNDCDDVLALGMIHALQSRGQCELLAVTTTKDHPQAPAFTAAVNAFYGRPDIPIGICRSGITPDAGKFNRLAEAGKAMRTHLGPWKCCAPRSRRPKITPW